MFVFVVVSFSWKQKWIWIFNNLTSITLSLTNMSIKLFTLAGLTAVSAFSEQALVDKINNSPDVTWKAEINGMDKASFKKLLGVHQGKSFDSVQALPKAVSKLLDSDIPDSFDSETNWPQCAKVIGDIRDQSM